MDFKPDEFAAVKAVGSQLQMNDKGYIRPRRDVKKLINGDLVEFTPPKLFLEDGRTEYDGKFVPRGSKVEVTVSLYDTKGFGKGTRLESVRIIEFAEMPEYKGDDEVDNAPEVAAPEVAKPKKKLPF